MKDTAGNEILEITDICDCGSTGGCPKCNPYMKDSFICSITDREAVEKFRSFCEGEVYEKRLSDEHYVLVSILIDAYLSSIGKEER